MSTDSNSSVIHANSAMSTDSNSSVIHANSAMSTDSNSSVIHANSGSEISTSVNTFNIVSFLFYLCTSSGFPSTSQVIMFMCCEKEME